MLTPSASMLLPLPRNWTWNLGEFMTVMPVTVTPLQLLRIIMAGGRLSEPPELKAAHQAAPCPSMVPEPLMVILDRLLPETKLVFCGKVPMAVMRKIAPEAS